MTILERLNIRPLGVYLSICATFLHDFARWPAE